MNASLLMMTMAVKDVKVGDICQALGISRASWFRKMKGITQFTREEISGISRVLFLDDVQLIQIFFPKKVTDN